MSLLTAIAVLLRICSNPFANVFQKQLTAKGWQPLQVNFLSYLLLSIACLYAIAATSWSALPAAFWWYAACSGVVGALGNGFLVMALKYGDLSVLGPINAYKSVVGIVIGIVLLGELPNLWGLVGVALIIAGSYFVLDTATDRFSWALLQRKEIRYRVLAMVLTGIEAVLTKKIILLSSADTAFVMWCLTGALFSFFFLLLSNRRGRLLFPRSNRGDLARIVALVICIGTMQYTTNYALAHMPVGYALSLFQLSAIVSVLLGYGVFREGGVRQKLLGSVIMVLGSLLVILMKG